MPFVASPSLDLARVVERHLPAPDKHNPNIVVRFPSRLRHDRTEEPSQVVFQWAFRLVASPVQKRGRVHRTASDKSGCLTAGSVGLHQRHVQHHLSMIAFGNLVEGSSGVLSVSSSVQSRRVRARRPGSDMGGCSASGSAGLPHIHGCSFRARQSYPPCTVARHCALHPSTN